MSGKDVLVENKLFSTLETTVGRMEASPRILLADTIGFIDNLPNATLDAFRATLAEALECDLLLLLIDATDDTIEFSRKLATSQREINLRYLGEEELALSEKRPIICVLTKIESLSNSDLEEKAQIVSNSGIGQIAQISTHQEIGLKQLQDQILKSLFGEPILLRINKDQTSRSVEGYISDVYESGLVINCSRLPDESAEIDVWISQQSLSQLIGNSKGRIEVK